MRYLLICNPTSRSGRSKKEVRKVLAEFNRRGMDHDHILTERKEHAINLARKHTCSGKYDVIIAIGGDGTICEVITGILKASVDREDIPRLGVIHIGTSPDFNKFHSIPTSIEPAVELIQEGRSIPIDIGKATLNDLDGKHSTYYFGSSVNLGLGPNIASRSNNRYRKFLGDLPGTLLAMLVSLSTYDANDLTAILDGKEKVFKDLINLTVGKDPHLASGMRVPIKMGSDDGRMYCLAICSSSKLRLMPHIWKMYKGNVLDHESASIRYCKSLEVIENRNDKVEFDGDHRGYLPLKVEIIPKALDVICNE